MPKKKNPKKQNKKSGNLNVLAGGIRDIFKQKHNKSLNHKQVAAALKGDAGSAGVVQSVLNQMLSEGILISPTRGKYMLANFSEGHKTGSLQVTRRGTGYVVTGDADDVYVGEHNLGHALDGDEVEVKITGNKGGQPAGKIMRVVNRPKNTFVGVIELSDHFAFVLPSNQRIHVDFFVAKSDIAGAKNGQKVVVELLDWPDKADNPNARVTEVLGNPGEHDVEMNAIMAEFGLPMEFPKEVLSAADQINPNIDQKTIESRRDFRDTTTFTIDPEDAKDFDDALSLRFLEDDCVEVGIHIADVTHYLEPGKTLDTEAINRATSVYLVDRVVPMLPEILSNVVCSLRPDEEKLCFSAVFKLNSKAEVMEEWFGKTIIKSNYRYSYEAAQKELDEGKGPHIKELNKMLELSKIMRKDRIEHGAIEFGGSEVKFELDENGKPIGIIKKVLRDTNRLIEDFMLLANKRVAAKVGKVKNATAKPFVYRVHDEPSTEKLVELKAFARRFGHSFTPSKTKGASYAITKLLQDAAGTAEEDVIRHMAIRSMAKAYYSTDNIGHYGLSFEYYSHFTSPIRRYPDVLVHRQLQNILTGAPLIDEEDLNRLCRHCSIQEKLATEAERSSIKYKQVEFMLDKVGEEFQGIISGITTWGIFVEVIETNSEGMISLNSMKDDHYRFDQDKYQLVGSRHGRVFNIGEQIQIRVVRGDLVNKQLDFELVD